MWFGQKTDLLLVHLEAGGPGYIVTSDQAVKGRFGSAFTYLARNRVLIEAWVSAGMNDALPGQPAASRNDCEPSRDVMYDIQYELFSQNRMVHFGLWAVCATQAAFFFQVGRRSAYAVRLRHISADPSTSGRLFARPDAHGLTIRSKKRFPRDQTGSSSAAGSVATKPSRRDGAVGSRIVGLNRVS